MTLNDYIQLKNEPEIKCSLRRKIEHYLTTIQQEIKEKRKRLEIKKF